MNEMVKASNKKELRNFGFLLAGFFALLFGTLMPLIFHHPKPMGFWVLAAIIAFFAFLLPGSLRPIYWIWLRIGLLLKWFNTKVILTAIFFVLFVPVRLIRGLFGKDAMRRKRKASDQTYREKSSEKAIDMEKPY